MKKVFLLILIFAFAVLSCENPFVTAFLPEIENADNTGNADNARNVTGIAVKTQPALIYTHGGTLDLSGLVVTVIYSNETSGDIAFAAFENFEITTVPADGAALSRTLHDGNPVTVIHGGDFSVVTDNLAVAKADPDYTPPSGLIANYGDTLADVALPNGWAWDDPGADAGSPGNNQHDAVFTPADTVNYSLVNIQLAVTVIDIAGISVKTQPALFYTHGDTLDLSGLVVTVTYNNAASEDVAFGDFADFGITTVPANGSALSHVLHDGEPVTVKRGSELSDATNNLTVGRITLTITGVTAVNRAYDGTTVVTLTTGTLEGIAGSDNVSPVVPPTGTIAVANVGDGKAVTVEAITLTGGDAGNYTLTQPGGITVDIAKADPYIPIDLTANEGVTLASVVLPSGWAWDNPSVSVGNAGNRQHYATFTPTDIVNFNTMNIQLTVTVKGPQTVNISFPQITGELLVWSGGEEDANSTITILRDSVLVLTLENPGDYTNIEWLLNPDEGGSVSGAQGYIFMFTPPERFDYTDSEVFTLTLRVRKDGVPYNRTVMIQVEEE